MTELLQFTLFGLMLGCTYAIASMGLVLTYTVTGVFNFSHGAIGMICAFVYYQLRVEQGFPTPLAILIVVGVLAPLMGLVLERLMRRFQGTDPTTSLVVTIALTVGLLGLAQQLFDPAEPRFTPLLFGDDRFVVAGVPIPYDRVAQVVVAAAIAFGLRTLLFRSGLGAQMRSVVDDPELARLSGIRPVRIARYSWVIGAALAGVGGVLFAGGQNLNAIVLTFLVLNAYAAAMVGRLRSLPMTFAGALMLGLAQELTNVSWLWPDGDVFIRLRLAIPGLFLVVAVALIPSVRLSAGKVVGVDQPPVPTFRRSFVASAGLVGAVLAVVAVLPQEDHVHLVRALVMAVVALSLVALTGLSGQLSLMQYLFLGIGAFVAGEWFGSAGLAGMLAGGFVSAAIGAVVALPAIRLKGLHLALSTFGVALAGREVLLGDPRVFGLAGIEVGRPEFLGISMRSDGAFAVWTALMFCMFSIGLVALRRSSFGRVQTATRDSEAATATLGVSIRRTKLISFVVSAFIAGCAGSLFGAFQGSVGSIQFEPVNGLVIVLFAFVGGITSIFGALLAGALFALLSFVQSTYPDLTGLVFIGIGAGAIALARQPNGVAGIVLEQFRGFTVRRRTRDGRPTQSEDRSASTVEPPIPVEVTG